MTEAPPPPSWPERPPRENLREEKRVPVWETESKKDHSRFDDRRSPRLTSDVWKTRDDKFSRTEEFGRKSPRREISPSPRKSGFQSINEFRLDDDYPKRQDDKSGYRKTDSFRKETDSYRKSPKDFGRRDDYGGPKSSFDDKEKYREQDRPRFGEAPLKFKYEKAVDVLQERFSQKHDLSKSLVREELRLTLSKKIKQLVGDREMSVHDILMRFDERYTPADCNEIFEEVLSCLPRHYRPNKEGKAVWRKLFGINCWGYFLLIHTWELIL